MERAERTAGEPQVYEDIKVRLKKMMQEVVTDGILNRTPSIGSVA